MKCESARDSIVLLNYGELPDELAGGLEQHLIECEGCRVELEAIRLFEERLAFLPVLFFADIVYLPPFFVILRRLYKLAASERAERTDHPVSIGVTASTARRRDVEARRTA